MENVEFDVVIIGAGAAGLAAVMRLSTAGRKVLVLEARNRIGGRIHTVDAEGDPVELGAEFVHGKAPVILELAKRYGLKLVEVDGDRFCNMGQGLRECDFFAVVDEVFKELVKFQGADVSFETFLNSICEDPQTREWARNYVAGFHGAPPEDAGVEALVLDTKAEEEIDGERSWRIEGGYRHLVENMWNECERNGVRLELNSLVERVEWTLAICVTASGREFRARKAIVTLPLSVLQQEAVTFEPPLKEKQSALKQIAMGDVARCVLHFRRRWWEGLTSAHGKSLRDASFLFSSEADFPTWWTQNPTKIPSLVGWASAVSAPGLTAKSEAEVEAKAIAALARIIGIDESSIRSELLSSHWHDWCADPWTRGAYTYARVGGAQGYRALAQPLGNTLFFAGEATDSTGNHATVHGAIASGYRAADEVLASRS